MKVQVCDICFAEGILKAATKKQGLNGSKVKLTVCEEHLDYIRKNVKTKEFMDYALRIENDSNKRILAKFPNAKY